MNAIAAEIVTKRGPPGGAATYALGDIITNTPLYAHKHPHLVYTNTPLCAYIPIGKARHPFGTAAVRCGCRAGRTGDSRPPVLLFLISEE